MNIGLLAMSGVRICDQELVAVGLTLPGFVERSKVIASLPSLGLLTLAAMTPEEHSIAYFEAQDIRDSEKCFDNLKTCDLVAISSMSAQIHEAYAIADKLRSEGITVVIGGLHATVCPKEASLHADAVVVGEGEAVWTALVNDASRKRLRLSYTSDGGFDLALSPVPRYDLITISQYNRLTVQTSRGCPHKCEFCASSILLTPLYKQKPIANVMREIDAICELWDNPFIEFADDNAFVNHDYWRQLLPELTTRRIKWFAETDVSVGRDPELLDLMRVSGCAQVLIGLESPTREGLAGIELRSDWKQKQWNRYRDVVRAIQQRGISVNGCFVIGLDGHDSHVFDDVFEFVHELGLHQVQVTVLTAFPGTPLYRRLRESGRLLEPENWQKCTLFDINYHPAHMSSEELRQGFRELVSRIYSDQEIDNRRRQFRQMVRAGHATAH